MNKVLVTLLRKIKVSCCVFMAAFSMSHIAFAQQTPSLTSDGIDRKISGILYDLNVFSSLKYLSEDLSKQLSEPNQSHLKYLRTVSSIELFHPDAESFIDSFLINNPYHPAVPILLNEWGKKRFHGRDWDMVVDIYEDYDFDNLGAGEKHAAKFRYAYALFNKKRFDEALQGFEQVSEFDNKYRYAAAYYAGFIYYNLDNYDASLKYLKKAEENEAYKSVVPSLLVSIYYKKRDFDKVISYGEQLLKNEQAKIRNVNDFYSVLGDAYYWKKNYEKAALYLGKGLGAFNVNKPVGLFIKLGFAAYKSGNYEQAVGILEKSATLDDSLGQLSAFYLGHSFFKLNNYPFAKTAYLQASEMDYLMDVQYAALKEYAKVSYDMGHFQDAIRALEKYRLRYKKETEINDLLSKAYLHTKDYQKALNFLDNSELDSRILQEAWQKVNYIIGMNAFNNENYPSSINHLSASQRFQVDRSLSMKAYFWKGEALYLTDKFESALGNYLKCLEYINYSESTEFIRANYAMGYIFYNRKEYEKALFRFEKFEELANPIQFETWYEDAIIRIADCYYIQKNYDKAILKYQQGLNLGISDKSYVLFQQGAVYQLSNRPEKAIINFNLIQDSFPNSIYKDRAMFQVAQIQLENSNYSKSIQNFTEFLNKNPESHLVPYAYLKRGIAYGNTQEFNEAIADYKYLLDNFILHPTANSALKGLQEMLGRVDSLEIFEQYLARYKLANPNVSGMENLEFQSAKNYYYNQKYKLTIDNLEAFLKDYPNTAHVTEASFYLGESYYRTGNVDGAIDYFLKVTEAGYPGTFYNRSVFRLADLYEQDSAFEKALRWYENLYGIASNKKERNEALTGLVRVHFAVDNYEKAMGYAEELIASGDIFPGDENFANLMMAKSLYRLGRTDSTIDFILTTLNGANDIYGAEAKYLLAKIQHEDSLYKQSLETLFDLNDNYNMYQEWIGKSFLLIAENYQLLGETYQAKSTLQSLIEHFPDKSVVDKASKMLKAITDKEMKEITAKDTIVETLPAIENDTLSNE